MFDAHGNAWTWCVDRRPAEGQEPPAVDSPDGGDLSDGSARIVRGGAYNDAASHLRCSGRLFIRPANRIATVGLRVGRTWK